MEPSSTIPARLELTMVTIVAATLQTDNVDKHGSNALTDDGDHSVGLLPITAEDGRNGALTFVTAMSVLMGFSPPAAMF